MGCYGGEGSNTRGGGQVPAAVRASTMKLDGDDRIWKEGDGWVAITREYCWNHKTSIRSPTVPHVVFCLAFVLVLCIMFSFVCT
jgi:hypothetical protein